MEGDDLVSIGCGEGPKASTQFELEERRSEVRQVNRLRAAAHDRIAILFCGFLPVARAEEIVSLKDY